tara:strand:- start:2565 stop:3818 length:1254 start_codon:yes stop_codon:yes gene_type:complete
MKNLFQFLAEAGASQASAQAAKLNLKSDGHGSWIDTRGNIVATTEKGRLVFIDRKKKAADEGPVRKMATARADDKLAGAPLQQKAPTKAAKPEEGEGEGKGGEGDTLTTAFGRFNPPTAGHEKLLSAARKAAVGGALKIYPSRSQDPKKNPLDPDMKISYMKKIFPDYEEEIINDSEMKTIFDVLSTAFEDGYKNVNIIVGADRQAEFENLATKYNGELYDFDNIRVISAGVRDADAAGVEGMSASKLRKAVADDDFKSFKSGMPKGVKDADTQAIFDAVRTGMKVKKKKSKEVAELWTIAPKLDQKGLRENYVNNKIFNIGDLIESLNTGLVGRIIRRGTNHLICLTKEENMFKSWVKDVMEYTEVRMKSRMRDKNHPNMLVGTTGYRKNAQAMVPGQEKIKNFNIKEFINKYRKK